MSYMISRHLNRRQLKTMERLGNILLPGYNNLPSFSETGCLFHIDTVLETSPDDTHTLKTVLSVLSYLPDSALRWVLLRLETAGQLSGWPGAQLRLLLLGIKGIVFSLYYSGHGSPNSTCNVQQIIGYRVHCRPDNRDGNHRG